jgi:hypothetical protein
MMIVITIATKRKLISLSLLLPFAGRRQAKRMFNSKVKRVLESDQRRRQIREVIVITIVIISNVVVIQSHIFTYINTRYRTKNARRV